MQSWLQPLPPADILVAAAAAFRKGGRLRPHYGVGLYADGTGPLYADGTGPMGLRSSFAPWILADMAQWARTGITQVTSGLGSDSSR